MTERWQRELRKLGTVEPERDAWKDLEKRGPGVQELPSRRRRLAAAIVAFATFGAASILLWQAFDPVGGPAAGGDDAPGHLPDAVRITCGTRRDEVHTPTVAAQPDGVHFLVENEVDARGSWAPCLARIRNERGCPRSPMGTPSAVRSSCLLCRPGSSTSRALGLETLCLLRDSARVNRCPWRSSTSMVSGFRAT